MQKNIVTLKWGNRYGAEYVNRLAFAVKRHTRDKPQVVCFTDDPRGIHKSVKILPIPEIDLPPNKLLLGWRKLCLFRSDLPIEGICLFLDLDIIIVGALDEFFSYRPEKFPIIQNWLPARKTWLRKRPNVGNSSVFRFIANQSTDIWDQFHNEKDWALADFHPPQTYLTHCIRSSMCYWPDHWVRSFKRHCQPVFPLNLVKTPKLPSEARIIVFHGKPDPADVIEDYHGEKLHHFCKATPWVEQHWTDLDQKP